MTETFTLRRSTVSIEDSIESRAGLMTNLIETPISALPDLLNMPTPHCRLIAAVLEAARLTCTSGERRFTDLAVSGPDASLSLIELRHLQILMGFLAPFIHGQAHEAPVMEWESSAGGGVCWIFHRNGLYADHLAPQARTHGARALAVTLDFDVTYRESLSVMITAAEAAEHFADPADPTIAEVQAALEAREGDPLEAYRESLVLGDDVVNVEAFPGGDLDIEPLD